MLEYFLVLIEFSAEMI